MWEDSSYEFFKECSLGWVTAMQNEPINNGHGLSSYHLPTGVPCSTISPLLSLVAEHKPTTKYMSVYFF